MVGGKRKPMTTYNIEKVLRRKTRIVQDLWRNSSPHGHARVGLYLWQVIVVVHEYCRAASFNKGSDQ